ncbi:MAG: hypothetical protein RL033_4725 [Pseudomonadota bacterium]|jgi:hypothetical protein
MDAIEARSRRAVRGWSRRAASALWLGALGTTLGSASCVKFASELDTVAPAEGIGSLANGEAPVGRDWSCAVDSAAGLVGTDSQEPLTYSFTLLDFTTRQPLDGVHIRTCIRADVNCDNPLGEASSGVGVAQVSAYEGFNGYLELTVPGMLPSLLFFAAPWSAELLAELAGVPVGLLPQVSLQALGGVANVQLDPLAGVVAVTTLDCTAAYAGGVRLELDRGAIPYAFVDDLPVVNRDFTSAQGVAGFVNVMPGIVVVSGFRADVSEPVSVESMLVRTGWVSQSFLLPAFSR